MSVGFGFSVGDFVAGIQLVREVICSLQSSAGSALEYQTLMYELFTLERALLEVKAIKFDDCDASHIDAIKCAATQCQSTIDRFLAKVTKYQPTLTAQGSGSKVRDGFRKIQWALCKKPDIEVFKAEVRGHAGSINLLLATAQMKQARIHGKRNEGHQEGLSTTLNKYFLGHMRALESLGANITTCIKQGQQLLQSTASILHTNLHIYEVVLQMHNFMQHITLHGDRQQPVRFIDAFGKESSFFLDWVYSPEVLQDWLERRFESAGRDKIIHKEFVIEDLKTRRQIDLTKPWDTLFYPGMHVGMDMVFTDIDCIYKNTCPSCGTETSGNADENVLCSHCGTNIRRITVLDDSGGNEVDAINDEHDSWESNNTRKRKRPLYPYSDAGTKVFNELRQQKRVRHDDLRMFRRLRLLSTKQLQPLLLGRRGRMVNLSRFAAVNAMANAIR